MTSPGDEEAHFLSFFCFSGLSFERCIGISSWRRHGGRRLSASASNVISPSTILSKGLSTLCSPFIPTQPPLFLSILTTLAPCSIHKPWDDKCPPPSSLHAGQDKTMPHSAAEYHPSRKSSIRDTKDEMLLQLPFFTKRVSHFSAPLSLFPHRLVPSCYVWGIWNIFLCINVHTLSDGSLMSCFFLPAVQQRICLTEDRHFSIYTREFGGKYELKAPLIIKTPIHLLSVIFSASFGLYSEDQREAFCLCSLSGRNIWD